MRERETERVQRLTRKRDRPQLVRPVDVAPLADERVSAQPRLQANLIALPRFEPDFDERRRGKLLDG